MKERMCYTALDFNEEITNHEMYNHNKVYELPDGQKISLGSEMCKAPEVLFQPSLIGKI